MQTHEIESIALPDFSVVDRLNAKNRDAEEISRTSALIERKDYASFFHDTLLEPGKDELTAQQAAIIRGVINRQTPDWQEVKRKIDQAKGRIIQARQLLLVAKGVGLGDELESAKFAQAIHKVTGKPVRCFVSTKIKELCVNQPGVEFIDQLDHDALLKDNSTFILGLNVHAKLEREIISVYFKELVKKQRILSLAVSVRSDEEERTALNDTFRVELNMKKAGLPNGIDLMGLALFEAMDWHISSSDLVLPLIEGDTLKVHPGILIHPDAAASTFLGITYGLLRPDFQNGSVKEIRDSVKLFPVVVWRALFTEMIKKYSPQDVTLAIGVDHTSYCVEVLLAAEEILGGAGWSVKNFKGTLGQFKNLIPDAKVVVTMDSMPAHLTSLIIKELKQSNLPAPKLLEIFNGDAFLLENYGIRGVSDQFAKIANLNSDYYDRGSGNIMMAADIDFLMSGVDWLLKP